MNLFLVCNCYDVRKFGHNCQTEDSIFNWERGLGTSRHLAVYLVHLRFVNQRNPKATLLHKSCVMEFISVQTRP